MTKFRGSCRSTPTPIWAMDGACMPPSNWPINYGTRLLSSSLSDGTMGAEIGQSRTNCCDGRRCGGAHRATGFIHAVVKHAGPGSDHRLRRLPSWPDAPGDTQARDDIVVVVDLGLCFITQAQAHGKIGPGAPIVEHEEPEVILAEAGQRVSGRNGKLTGTAAGRPDLLRGPACLLAH